MRITGSTRLAAVIGHPVGHSLSPALYNAAFAETEVDQVFVAFDVVAQNLTGFVDSVRTLDITGFSVTMPHKEAILSLVDEVSASAAALGAANCVVNQAGVLRASNTDGDGFVKAVAHDFGFDVVDSCMVVLGAGGAARSLVEALARHGAREIVVVNRSPEAAARAVALGGGVARVGLASDIATADLVVNATPLGMHGDKSRQMPCDPARLRAGQFVVDLIYAPHRTRWLDAAESAGAEVANGLSMLVFQAATQFFIWTGLEAPITTMLAVVESEEAS
ncbi:MAG: shikimate dehydrogenase [Acidimicrobiales bacterium]